MEACKPIRDGLLEKHKLCWICGHGPSKPWVHRPREFSELSVHEISRGPLRCKSLGKLFCLMVTCWWCNSRVLTERKQWPEARQLAVLLEKAPESFDLVAYLELTNPRAMQRITMEEIRQWM
jgi:hypothetical protein